MVNRKTHKSPLTKQMFWEINRTITLSVVQRNYDAHRIALEHGVSDETVRGIRRTGTWPKYEEAKRARNLSRGRTHEVPVPPVEPLGSPRISEEDEIKLLVEQRDQYRKQSDELFTMYKDARSKIVRLERRRFVLRLGGR